MVWIVLLGIAAFLALALVSVACFLFGFIMTVDIMRFVRSTNLLKSPEQMKKGN